jgi:RsiW-degrading membrane proteinase PrsW (M82 family)
MLNGFLENGLVKTTIFSFIEELAKLSAVFIAALGTVWNNEKRDPMIYMIIGALGFTAVENFYYILDSLKNFEYLNSLIGGSYRFLGASLLHVITSATIGLFISFVFFKRKKIRMVMAFLGLIFATGIHTLFNFLVLSGNDSYEKIAFYGSWFLIIILLIIFEVFDKKEKYRIRKDGVIYYHEKNISFEEKMIFKKNKDVEHEHIFLANINKKKLSEKEFETYDDDKFRKKFY